MSAQSNRRQTYAPRHTSLPKTGDRFQTRQCGKEETIRLLTAPSVDADAMWKAQAFDFARDQLRTKMNDKVSADTIIQVMNEHLPMPTVAAEQEARRVVSLFGSAFGNVKNLTPAVMRDREGDEQTGRMYKSPRPANVTHLGIRARIEMKHLSDAFDDAIADFNLAYFLELPQSFAPQHSVGTPSISSISSLSGLKSVISSAGIDTFDANFFSPAKKKRIYEPIPQDVQADNSSFASKIDEAPSLESQLALRGTHLLFDDKGDEVAVKTKEDDGFHDEDDGAGKDSQDSWQFAKTYRANPKMAKLIDERKRSYLPDSNTMYTYQGPLGILDSQNTFNSEIEDWTAMYELNTGIPGKPTVINISSIRDKLDKVSNMIQFRVFCHSYQHAYVGTDGTEKDAEGLIIASVQKALRQLRMRYKDNSTGRYFTRTPDELYKIMSHHIALLPEDATGWAFCLPWMFFNALSYRLQSEMHKNKYKLPNPAMTPTKTLQIESMTECRDQSRISWKAIGEMRREIADIMNTSGRGTAGSNINNVGYMGGNNLHDVEEDDYNPTQGQEQTDGTVAAFAFNPKPRAEETMEREYQNKMRKGLLPPGFVQKFRTTNGCKYPLHPDGRLEPSNFPVGFRGCFNCGGEHLFSEYSTRIAPDGRTRFNFNLEESDVTVMTEE